MLQKRLSHKICASQQSIFLIVQNIMIDPQQQQVSDDFSSSGQDSCQYSQLSRYCPQVVNCSKSQKRIDLQCKSEKVCCMPLIQILEKWF